MYVMLGPFNIYLIPYQYMNIIDAKESLFLAQFFFNSKNGTNVSFASKPWPNFNFNEKNKSGLLNI